MYIGRGSRCRLSPFLAADWRGKAGGGSICHRPRGPLSPVAFSGGARWGAAVACRLFRRDRGSSQGVLTPPPAFQEECRRLETATLSAAELQAEYSEAQLAALPGYRRLSPDGNGAGFEGQWELLLDTATAVLAQVQLPETSEAALAQSLIGSQFADQATGETVGQFFVRLKRAYSDCRSSLDRLSCRRLMPHPDTLVPMVFQRTRVEYSAEVRDMLRVTVKAHRG